MNVYVHYQTIFFIANINAYNFNPAVDTKSVLRGQTMTLSCPIDSTNCGELHSIKWFKGIERVSVTAGDDSYSQVEGPFKDRYVKFNIFLQFHCKIVSTGHF